MIASAVVVWLWVAVPKQQCNEQLAEQKAKADELGPFYDVYSTPIKLKRGS